MRQRFASTVQPIKTYCHLLHNMSLRILCDFPKTDKDSLRMQTVWLQRLWPWTSSIQVFYPEGREHERQASLFLFYNWATRPKAGSQKWRDKAKGREAEMAKSRTSVQSRSWRTPLIYKNLDSSPGSNRDQRVWLKSECRQI